jgi:hypothetical protein
LVRGLKDPPARLLDQARVRDGAFDIGMFRSYWERATKVTGERIADLSARPLQPSNESIDASEASADEPIATERVNQLSGLISRVLESADQLAASTRRSWKGAKVSPGEPGPTDPAPE